jgi:LuxR family maltose regulon positive regulatory protein
MQQRVMASEEPVRELADWFAEHLKRAVCTIVIDDFHYAAVDPGAIALLADLIERHGERIKWIVATRSDAGLPVASWVGYGRMDLPIGEEDLRFTPEEALAAAGETQTGVDADEIETLRELTEGWPVALAIALRTRTHASDLRSASAGTREMVYRYLAEQVFAGLDPPQRAFLLATCVFSMFDLATAEALGGTPELLAGLRRSVTFLNLSSAGAYRYHDLFREFLESELRRSGEREWIAALTAAATLLEHRGDDKGALALYSRARDADAVVRVVERSGLGLFERGEAETLAAVLDALPDAARNDNAWALGLRAMLEASRGHFELAEPGFVAAIERGRARKELHLTLVHRYAIELVRHGRDCVDLLEPYAGGDTVSPNYRVPILGTLSTGYVRAGRISDALVTIRKALDLLEPSTDEDVRARIYQQAAFVYQFETPRDRARTHATLAVELALKRNLYEVAARAYSVLYTIANDEADDPIASLAILDKLGESARKGASHQARLFAAIASFEIEVERGDETAIGRLDRTLEASRSGLPQARDEALQPALAMRAAWDGDFRRAYALLAGTAESQGSDERRALRAAETALYANAAGLQAEGDEAVRIALEALERSPGPTRRTARCLLFLALADLACGRAASAQRHLSEAERTLSPSLRRLRSLAQAIRTLYRVQLGQADASALTGALERLRAEHLGGVARLLETIPFAQSEQQGYALLTPSEREILQLLAGGASTKDVALKTARSPQTVDTHIRSICRKLGCSGRREAVALAMRGGWVQA